MNLLGVATAACMGAVMSHGASVPPKNVPEGMTVVTDHTEIDKHPWMTSILYAEKPNCGGALINPTWVITASHCETKEGDQVAIGGRDINNLKEFNVRTVKRVLRHELYEKEGMYSNDITLLKLDAPVNATSFMRLHDGPAPPADSPKVATSTAFQLFGWGLLEEKPNLQVTVLQTGTFVNVDVVTCGDAIGQKLDKRRQVCAGGMERDACKGDSGGALFNEGLDRLGDTHDSPCQVGIVSFGPSCKTDDEVPEFRASVYTFVSYYLSWIREQMKKVDGEKNAGFQTCQAATFNRGYREYMDKEIVSDVSAQQPEEKDIPGLTIGEKVAAQQANAVFEKNKMSEKAAKEQKEREKAYVYRKVQDYYDERDYEDGEGNDDDDDDDFESKRYYKDEGVEEEDEDEDDDDDSDDQWGSGQRRGQSKSLYENRYYKYRADGYDEVGYKVMVNKVKGASRDDK